MNTSSSALNQTARNSVHTSLPLSLPNLPEVTSSSPNALPPFQTTNHDGVSLRNIDGKASIEHLISIHVQDLLEVSTHPESFSLSEILAGVQYLMDYRIHGGKMPNLDLSIMIKLLDVLLLHMKHTVPSFLGTKKVSNEANQAFVLFVQFTLEVQEARIALADKPVAVLRHALVLHQRLKVPELHVWIQCVLKWFPTWSPQITHWKDIVEESRHSSFMALYKATFSEAFLSSHPLFIPPPLNKRQIYPPPGLYFDRTIEKVRFMFKTDLEKGLHPSQLPDLLSYYGRNQLPDAPKPSLFQVLFSQFKDFMMLVLLIAAVVEFAFNEYDSGGILMAVVLLNAFIGFIQEWRANQVLDALSKLNVPTAKVLRQGPMEIIQATDLVPGDLVVLEEGDWVPADLRITQAYSLEVIESILTGETVPVKKSTLPIRHETRRLPLGDCTTNAFMSTLVAKGRGQGIVVRIGVHTEMGKISKAITSTPALITPIQKKLKVLGMVLVVVAFGLCALVVILGLAYKHDAKEMLKVGISLAVSVIPEGLITVVTVTMVFAFQRMAKQNAIVRRLPSVETLGSVTTICSDKTGTLTEGKMGVSSLWTIQAPSTFTFTEPTILDPRVGEMVPNKDEQGLANLAMQICALCNNATIAPIEEPTTSPTSSSSITYKAIGDSTEIALVIASERAKVPKHFWTSQGWQRVHENAFDSDRKVMSVLYTTTPPSPHPDTKDSIVSSDLASPSSSFTLFAKGAPEEVIQRCTHTMVSASPHWTTQPFDSSIVQLISDQASKMAADGLRVLGLACRSLSLPPKIEKKVAQAEKEGQEEEEEDMTEDAWSMTSLESEWNFVGLIGLMDPPRQGVKESVQLCSLAGIRVIMITGDHITTAMSIATQLGVFNSTDSSRNRAMRGAELDLISELQLSQLQPFPTVFARVSPDHKLKIVQALQKANQLVAMTGDGVNDAPAIKAADVGVAMGVGGTEITKQAADMILTNDDFTTIVKAVKEGRRVFDNITKFIVYLLSCNSAEIWLMLVVAAMNRRLPFTTMTILWANIIADIPPALALGMERPEPNIMERSPRSPTAGALDPSSIFMIVVQGWSMALISISLYLLRAGENNQFSVPENEELFKAQSVTFATLTTLQLFQGFLSRSVTLSLLRVGLFGNLYMVVAVLGSFTFLLLGFYVDPLALWLGLVPLDEWDWGQVAICLLIHFVITEVLKFSVRCQLYSILKQYFLFRTFKVKKPEIQEFQPTSPGLV